jgi:hypothetical protein
MVGPAVISVASCGTDVWVLGGSDGKTSVGLLISSCSVNTGVFSILTRWGTQPFNRKITDNKIEESCWIFRI